MPVVLQRYFPSSRSLTGSTTSIQAIVVGDRVVCAIERSANNEHLRSNMSCGNNTHKITLYPDEVTQCVKAAQAVGLEFAGVELIRELGKVGVFYIMEVNGNPGGGIIDTTGKNYFVDLVAHIEAKTDKASVTDTTETDEGETTEESSQSKYRTLDALAKSGQRLTMSQTAKLAYYQLQFGPIGAAVTPINASVLPAKSSAKQTRKRPVC